MKKLLLATAVAALSVTAAQAAPTIYGKAYLTLDLNQGDTKITEKVFGTQTTVKTKGRSQLNSNASRIGFKGSEGLSPSTDLVYKLEYRVEVDDDTRTFEARDAYMGLSHKQYGTLVAGRLSAIDGNIDYANVATGGVLGGAGVLTSVDADRANNAFAYTSPNYNGATFSAMYVMDENNATDTFGRDALGLAVQYEPQGAPFKAGASYLRAGKTGTFNNAFRLSGEYNFNRTVKVGALYQQTDLNTADKEKAIALSGSVKTATPWTAYGQLDLTTNVKGAKDSDAQRLLLGGKYAFNKATTGHLYGAVLNEKAENALVKTKFTGVGVGGGIEYVF